MTPRDTFEVRSGALKGIKAVELNRVPGGPLYGQILGDHGADVIKVEPPVSYRMRPRKLGEHADEIVEDFVSDGSATADPELGVMWIVRNYL